MRKTLLMSAAFFGLALAVPAFAQNTNAAPGTNDNADTNATAPPTPSPRHMMRSGAMNPATGARYGHTPGVGMSEPSSGRASNILPSDTRSVIAPTLPVPAVGPNASPERFLSVAQRALDRHRSGEAQEALERAMTGRLNRLSQRSANPNPNDPMIGHIRGALDSIARHDWGKAHQQIADAMGMGGGPGAMGNGMHDGMHRGMRRGMGGGGMSGAAAPGPGVNGQNPVYNTPGSGMYAPATGNPNRTSEPGTLGTEVTPPGTQMNPAGQPTQ